MKYGRNHKKIANPARKITTSLFAVILTSLLFTAACADKTATPRSAKEEVCVTVFDGEHYKVKGENKKTVARGESVAYEIAVDEGYELVSSFGAECAVPSFKGSYSFNQSVQFTSVNYDTTVTLQTRKLETTEFKTDSNVDGCEVEVQTASGYTNNGEIYSDDVVNLYAIPAEGYRFHCWSTGNYLSAGGKYLSNEKILNEFDFNTTNALYANFKSTADSARSIIYDFGDGNEIEQDCSAMVAHHPRANTLTEPDLIENGYELPKDKMLVGWKTENGEYVGLGSRTAVSDETFITLTPVWKEYADESDFEISDGKITNYVGESKEVVIPKAIGGEEVTGIAANAFEECAAETYYVPNTITSVEENAFLNCIALKTFYMSDNVMTISDSSFRGCKNFETLHLNAYLKPRYVTSEYSNKCDVYDRLAKNFNDGKKKLVLLGGSSVKYGYNSPLIEEMLDGDYDVYNIAQTIQISALAQTQAVAKYLGEGDVFIHAPENEWSPWFGGITFSEIVGADACNVMSSGLYIYYIFESNLQLFSNLSVNHFARIFNLLAEFNKVRLSLVENQYYDYFINSDESVILNKYGDAVANQQGDAFKDSFFDRVNFGLSANTGIIERCLNDMYSILQERNVKVCFTFYPVNESNLLKTYTEEEILVAADKFTKAVKDILEPNNICVLLNQNDTVYESECFYDSDRHLGYPTRDVHTRKVMNALIEELKKNGGGV